MKTHTHRVCHLLHQSALCHRKSFFCLSCGVTMMNVLQKHHAGVTEDGDQRQGHVAIKHITYITAHSHSSSYTPITPHCHSSCNITYITFLINSCCTSTAHRLIYPCLLLSILPYLPSPLSPNAIIPYLLPCLLFLSFLI